MRLADFVFVRSPNSPGSYRAWLVLTLDECGATRHPAILAWFRDRRQWHLRSHLPSLPGRACCWPTPGRRHPPEFVPEQIQERVVRQLADWALEAALKSELNDVELAL